MLPASSRVRSRSEHRLVAARGRRARRGPIVVHLLSSTSVGRARAGVIVGKRVGPAVRRNLVKRRLREQLRSRLPMLSDGDLVVVRALPGADEAGFERLGSALDEALSSLGARSAASGTRAPRAGRQGDAKVRDADTVATAVRTAPHGAVEKAARAGTVEGTSP